MPGIQKHTNTHTQTHTHQLYVHKYRSTDTNFDSIHQHQHTITYDQITIQNTDQTYIDKNMPPLTEPHLGSVLRWARATIGSLPTRFLRRSSRHNTKRTSPTDLLPNETHDQTDCEQKVTTNAKRFVLGVVHCAFVVFSSFCQ